MVSIRIGGATYRVLSSASPEEVQRLADRVSERLRELNPGELPASPQAFLLVALSFAHDLEEERLGRQQAESEVRDLQLRLNLRGEPSVEVAAPAPRHRR